MSLKFELRSDGDSPAFSGQIVCVPTQITTGMCINRDSLFSRHEDKSEHSEGSVRWVEFTTDSVKYYLL